MLSRIILRDPQHNCWYDYRDPVLVIQTRQHADILPMLADIESQVETDGLFAAGFLTYEAATAFDHHLVTHAPGSLPLLCFGLFDRRTRFDQLPVQQERDTLDWQISLSESDHCKQVLLLKQLIEAGDAYQVNYTARVSARGAIDLGTFARMAGDSPYGAYIDGDDFSIASASPELFFELEGNLVTSSPMKGTTNRGLSSRADQLQANWLGASQKDQAENLMITDMVRNDLSRVADTQSVSVPEIFSIEQHPTVWQMTSKVTARSDASIVSLLTALFPAASITGAPKRASMEIINRIEPAPREIYTGTIGLITPNRGARFNVAIRTAWTNKRANTSHYGAGGGIIWDSVPTDEYKELQLKTRILHERNTQFELFETMRWTPGESIYLQSQHLKRLFDSANYFKFKFDPESIVHSLAAYIDRLEPKPHRLRLRVNKQGHVKIDSEQLTLTRKIQQVALAATPVSANNPLLYHKTTNRQIYQQAQASVPEGTEAVLHNSDGFITESVIANIVFRIEGQLYTPPVSDGLLPGTLREDLLSRGKIRERSLSLDKIPLVEDWFLINALRGQRPAKFMQ